jgi:putative tryptophan/tyrosine transport system substrate-binding protein
MRRRQFITLIGGSAAALPLAALARQAGKPPIVGFIGPNTDLMDRPRFAHFAQQLRELGWIEDRSVVIEYRTANGRAERVVEIATGLVGLKVDVIVTAGDAQVLAAKQATATIPIVFAAAGDPVGNGLVASLARPGGNVTGLSLLLTDTAGKRLELLREIVPGLRRLAILGNFSNPTVALELEAVQAAAQTFRLDIAKAEIRTNVDIASVIEPLQGHAEALYVCQDPLVGANSVRINTLARAAQMPVMLAFRDSVETPDLLRTGHPRSVPACRRNGR